MDGKKFFVFALIALLILSVVGVGYFILKNKGTTEDLPNVKLYVDAIDKVTKKEVETKFVIVNQEGADGSVKNIVYDGKTHLGGNLEEAEFPLKVNTTYYVLNYGSGYYSNAFVLTNQNRATLELYKIGELNVSLVNRDAEKYIINITTDGNQYRQVGFCIKHSIGYLDVKNNDYTEITAPTRLKSEYPDKCYYTFGSLDQSNNYTATINLQYTQSLVGVGNTDWVELIFFDSDRNYKNEYTFEDGEGNDIGGSDYRLEITN